MFSQGCVWCPEAIGWPEGKDAWRDLQSYVAVEAERILRAHWCIEHHLHRMLEVVLKEALG